LEMLSEASGLPPGPTAPPIWQTAAWLFRPTAFMTSASRRYGNLFTIRLAGLGDVVLVSEPELIKRVFTGDARQLHAGEAATILEPLVGRNSVLLLDESRHLAQRRVMLPPFHGERIRSYESTIAEIADASVERWPIGRPFALQPEMGRLTLEVIVRVIFGVRESDRREALQLALRELLESRGWRLGFQVPALRRAPLGGGPWAKFLRLRERVDVLVFEEIARRRQAVDLEERADTLSLLLQSRHEDGSALSSRELRDELVTLLLAGHETTAITLAWIFDLLFRHPQIEERLREERAQGGHDYADAVVREALRLRPVVPIVARRLTAPLELGGHRLPEGVVVSPAIYLTHHRPDLYPHPERFLPERFLGTTPDTYAWLPFGGGVRRCIGASFALVEARVVLQRVLGSVRLGAASPRAARVVQRAVVLAPHDGTRTVVHRRLAPSAAIDGAAMTESDS
jgi:cytochrome P450